MINKFSLLHIERLKARAELPGMKKSTKENNHTITVRYRNAVLLIRCADKETFSLVRREVSWLEPGRIYLHPDVMLSIRIDKSLSPYHQQPMQFVPCGINKHNFRREDIRGTGYFSSKDGFVFAFEISPYQKSLWGVLRTAYASVAPLKNTLLLHASAIKLGNRGILFMGHSGSGKSTAAMTASKTLRRCLVLNDDVSEVQVDIRNHRIVDARIRTLLLVRKRYRPKKDMAARLENLYWIKGWRNSSAIKLSRQDSLVKLTKSLMCPLMSCVVTEKALDLILALTYHYPISEVETRDLKNALVSFLDCH